MYVALRHADTGALTGTYYMGSGWYKCNSHPLRSWICVPDDEAEDGYTIQELSTLQHMYQYVCDLDEEVPTVCFTVYNRFYDRLMWLEWGILRENGEVQRQFLDVNGRRIPAPVDSNETGKTYTSTLIQFYLKLIKTCLLQALRFGGLLEMRPISSER